MKKLGRRIPFGFHATAAAVALLVVAETASGATFARELPDVSIPHLLEPIVRVAADGGLLVAVGEWITSSQERNWLARLDDTGEPIWLRLIGDNMQVRALAATSDGGALVGALYIRSSGYGALRLYRFDAAGGLLWQRGYERNEGLNPVGCVQTSDGGFACTGGAGVPPFGAFDGFLLKIDAAGDLQFFNLYGDQGPRDDYPVALSELPGSGYALSGLSKGKCARARLDAAGTVLSVKSFPIDNYYFDCEWRPAADGGWVVMATLEDGVTLENSVLIARLDPQDAVLWTKQLSGRGGTGYEQLVPMPDGGVVVTSYSNSDGWAARLDGAGNMLWDRAIGDALHGDFIHSARLHPDGDLVLAGYRIPPCSPCDSTPRTAWIAKLDAAGMVAPSCPLLSDTTTSLTDFNLVLASDSLGSVAGTLALVSSAQTVSSLPVASTLLCGGVACASTLPVSRLLAVKLPAGRAQLSWDGSADPCHARYRVYQSTAPDMRPANPPGNWPVDPVFADVSAGDLDGSDTNAGCKASPMPEAEVFFLVTDVGSNGAEGPVGSYGR